MESEMSNNNNAEAAMNMEDEDTEAVVPTEEMENPNEIHFESQVFELEFHPHQDLLATGLISGNIQFFKYGGEENVLVYDLNFFTKACRAMRFSKDGNFLLAGGKDKSIRVVDVNMGKLSYTHPAAHRDALSSMVMYMDYTLITGDDSGVIKVWDLRTKNATHEWRENTDFISDFVVSPDFRHVLCTGGDGHLSIYDPRKGSLFARSDNMGDELLCLTYVRDGQKLLVGTQTGAIEVFNAGKWDNLCDRIQGHPMSVDTMALVDQKTICTGSSDGLIRAISIYPHRILSVIGDHSDFPIERVRLSRDKKWLASCSHDMTVKFWDVEYLQHRGKKGEKEEEEEEDDDDDDDDSDDEGKKKPKKNDTMELEGKSFNKKSRRSKNVQKDRGASNFFAGIL